MRSISHTWQMGSSVGLGFCNRDFDTTPLKSS